MAAEKPLSAEEGERRLPRLLSLLADLQARRPWLLVVLAALSLIPTAYATSKLGFKGDFAELLPDNKDSVIHLRRVSQRLAGSSTLSVVLRTSTPGKHQELQACADALVPALYTLGKDSVGAIDYGVKDARRFFEENALLYASLPDLKKAHERITERYDWEVSKEQGSLLD